jgi:hypothetical protein
VGAVQRSGSVAVHLQLSNHRRDGWARPGQMTERRLFGGPVPFDHIAALVAQEDTGLEADLPQLDCGYIDIAAVELHGCLQVKHGCPQSGCVSTELNVPEPQQDANPVEAVQRSETT